MASSAHALEPPHPRSGPLARASTLPAYLWTIGCVGSFGALAGVAAIAAAGHLELSPTLAAFAALVVLAELRPITITRGAHTDAVTTSSLFVFAILLEWGLGPALVAQCVSSLVDDARDRPFSRVKALFNVGQYSLALGGAALVLHLSEVPSDPSFVEPSELLAVAAAGATFLILNHVLPGIALALADEQPIGRSLVDDLPFQASVTGALLALSPIVLVATERTYLLAPMLAIPMVVVHRSARATLEKQHLILHDGLTGLPNRAHFQQQASELLDDLDPRHGQVVGVVVLDVDDFKEINDTLGHQAGDVLLCQIAERLRDAVDDSIFLARVGGDEFALLLPQLDDPDEPERVAAQVIAAFEDRFRVDDFEFDLRISAGIATFPDDGLDVRVLMQRADVAMYAAKRRHNGWERYEVQGDQHSRRRLALMSDLRKAASDGSLIVHYQPQADLETGRIVGAEALVRWDHPRYGLVPPDDFIPLAEQTGVIREVTGHVLRTAIAQQARWQVHGHDLRVAINVSTCDLRTDAFVDQLEAALHEHAVDATSVELEITESGLIEDVDRTISTLEELRALGVKLAVDDYGTGYASLGYLSRLPIDVIKIDRSFVSSMGSVATDAVIVRSTIDLARNLGLEVVAEGVESHAVWQSLQGFGCDLAQGYYLSRPVPADVLTRLLDQQPATPVVPAVPTVIDLSA